MLKIKPTSQNIFIFSIIYQLFPIALYFLALLANPDSKPWSLFSIFVIAEILLIIVILSWKRKVEAEVTDEREIAIQLKVKSVMLNTTYMAIGITLLINAIFYKEMPGFVALLLIIPPGIIAEAFANWHYRKL